MALNPQNTYLVLTKRAWRMQEYFKDLAYRQEVIGIKAESISGLDRVDWTDEDNPKPRWTLPLSNVWLGVTAENQKTADERIPQLTATPAAVRFISFEPLLEYIELEHHLWKPNVFMHQKDIIPSWIICGAETGAGCRPCKEEWIYSLVSQCKNAGIPCWVKQINIDGKIVHDISKFPKDLQLRQFPTEEK
jgi:protein gp37